MIFHLISLFLLSVQHQSTTALVPTICANNATKSGGRVCCPTSPDNGLVCGGPTRGLCQYYQVPVTHSNVEDDIRLYWPVAYFDYTCECFDRYFGFACESCWFGWEGKHCNQRQRIKIRRDIRSYSKTEKLTLVFLFRQSEEYLTEYSVPNEVHHYSSSKYWIPATLRHLLSSVHHYASRETLKLNCDEKKSSPILNFNHEGPGFLMWHRYFMLFWEKQFEKIAQEILGLKSFTFPFWDWTDKEECEICTNDLVGASGKFDEWGYRLHKKSHFHHFAEHCSYPWDWNYENDCFACEAQKIRSPLTRQWTNKTFPRLQDVEKILNFTRFHFDKETFVNESSCTFCFALEDGCQHSLKLRSHNHVHNLVEGTFKNSPTSPSDPFFPFHHTQIDRIFQKWFMKNQPTDEQLPLEHVSYGHCRDCLLMGFYPLLVSKQMFVDTRDLGYSYEHFEFGKSYPESQKD